MRIRLGVAMPDKGGRTAIVGVEVREASVAGRRVHHFTVGHVDRVEPGTVEASAARVAELVEQLRAHRPCVTVDLGNPQGHALRRMLRKMLPSELHRPHGYERTKADTHLFAQLLEAYADDRVAIRDGLQHVGDLSLALAMHGAKKTDRTGAVELSSEDEALVTATCLGLTFPTHGAVAAKWQPPSQEQSS